MKSAFTTLALILALSTFAHAEGKARFQITALEDKRSIPVVFTGNNGGNFKQAALFRVQFKILDPSINKLDFVKIYFFNDQKELVDSMLPTWSSYMRQNYTLRNLKELEMNRLYNVEFVYPKGDLKWKYMIAVLGNKDEVVSYVKPQGEKASSFVFPEKEKLVD
jgi:hypothetical protein